MEVIIQVQFYLEFRAGNFFISRKQVCLLCRVLPAPSDTGIHREDPLAPPEGSASLHACPQTGHAGPLCEVLPVTQQGLNTGKGGAAEPENWLSGMAGASTDISSPLKNHTHCQHENHGKSS